MGNKIEHFSDDQGYLHEAEFDVDGSPVSDKRFDKDGNLVSEGIYKNGDFIGHKEYMMHEGYRHEVEYDVFHRPLADRKYDGKGTLVEEKKKTIPLPVLNRYLER